MVREWSNEWEQMVEAEHVKYARPLQDRRSAGKCLHSTNLRL